jgi:hypothetical protein
MVKLIMLGGGQLSDPRTRSGLSFRLACAMAQSLGYARGYIDGRLMNRFGTTVFDRSPDKKLLGRRSNGRSVRDEVYGQKMRSEGRPVRVANVAEMSQHSRKSDISKVNPPNV